MDTLLSLYSLLCAAAFVQACLMFLHAWEHSRYHASRRQSELVRKFTPHVTLFVPCKGVDLNLDCNLRALFEQKYPRFELCFVVESAGEPVVQMIDEFRRKHVDIPCRVVIAGEAKDCGQKVHNLMAATHTVSLETEVMAFVDSDACPHPYWLERLVSRLERNKYAVSTGYRWYVPVERTLPNLLLSAINNGICSLMGAHGFNLVWGGAWAIRTETFRQLGLPNAWRGSLSDDLVISKLVHRAKLRLVYEPHCLVTSPAQVTTAGLAEFIRRQYLVVRVYAPAWWSAAFWAGAVSNLTFWLSLTLTFGWLMADGPWWIPLGGGLLHYTLTSCRAAICTAAVRPFVKAPHDSFHHVTRLSVWGWPLVALVNWLGLLSTSVGRVITWRGIRYRLVSANETVIENRVCNNIIAPTATTSQNVQRPVSRAA